MIGRQRAAAWPGLQPPTPPSADEQEYHWYGTFIDLTG